MYQFRPEKINVEEVFKKVHRKAGREVPYGGDLLPEKITKNYRH
jgi:hypothetical protein